MDRSVGALRHGLKRPLFVHDAGGIRLAPTNTLLLGRIRPTVGLVSHNRDRLLRSNSLNLKRLRVNTDSAVYHCFLLPCLRGFRQGFPSIPVGVAGTDSVNYMSLLRRHQMSLVVAGFPGPRLGPSCVRGAINSFSSIFITGPTCFSLTSHVIPFSRLNACPLVVLSHGDAADRFLRRVFLRRRLRLLPRMRLDDGSLLVSVTHVNLKVTFVPSFYLGRGPRSLFLIHARRAVPRQRLITSLGPALPISTSARRFLGLLPSI